jgi:hypothetical protein
MPDSYRIKVSNYSDAVLARMQARQAARIYGFTLKNQASISLAMWSLASTMGLGQTCKGEIIIEQVRDANRSGMRVTCSIPDVNLPEPVPGVFNQTRWMVDELIIKPLPEKGFEVTTIKWLEENGGN